MHIICGGPDERSAKPLGFPMDIVDWQVYDWVVSTAELVVE